MAGDSLNPEAGRRLRAARDRLGLSTREVERLSRGIAEQKQNQEYYISHAWLSEIERGELAPGIFKIYSLAVIYQHRFDQVLAFFGLHLDDLAREQMRQPLPRTQLVGAPPEIASTAIPGIPLDRTNLVSRMFSGFQGLEAELFPQGQTGSAVYGYVGAKDLTLYPVVRPGSFVQIDTSQRRIEVAGWPSVFERPIYFIELRDEYACSWCEQLENSLLLIPYPRSSSRIREVRYPAEAEIIGRVTAVTMRIDEPREKSATGIRT
jgi:transcriptional regulator with XRE-family HTH domain